MKTSNKGLVELVNWPGYAADIDGNIYSLNYNQQKYIRKLVPSLSRSGYFQVTLCKKGKRVSKRVNRVIAEQFLPDFVNKPHVNHLNGIKTDNSVSNLEMATAIENSNHAVKIGLIDQKGSKHPGAKLNEEQVREIKYLLDEPYSNQAQISKSFGVSKHTVHLIYKGKTWKHVGDVK